MTFRLALIGFGGVNQGLVSLLKAKQGKLGDLDIRITALADLRLGVVSNPQGIDLDALLATADSGFATDALRSDPATRISEHIDLAATLELVTADYVDVVVEATFTDPHTGEPALSHCRAALSHGKHVITTNKGPIALAQQSLTQLAAANGAAAHPAASARVNGAAKASLAAWNAASAPAMPAARCAATPLEGVEPLVAPHAGLLVFAKAPGRVVQAGELVAELIDPLTDAVTPLRAGVSGLLFARVARRWASRGMRVAKIAGAQAYRSGKLLSM